jgi:hypothetical protein
VNEGRKRRLSGKRVALAVVALIVLFVLWWEFRPEKLWVNVKVNEAPPVDASPDPLYTGLLESRAHPTSGRASVYTMPDGKRELRLTQFTTSNGPDVHVVLARSGDESLKQTFVKSDLNDVELGGMKANEGDQNYDVPVGADLTQYDEAVIYCVRFHAIFGLAKLEKF